MVGIASANPVQNEENMSAATVIKEKNIDVLVAERKKEALEVIAPKIIDIVTTFGMRTPTGYKYEKDGCVFTYNELFGVVQVVLGPGEQFGANPTLKTVTIYRNGSWMRVLNISYEKYLEADKKEFKQRLESRWKDFFGV